MNNATAVPMWEAAVGLDRERPFYEVAWLAGACYFRATDIGGVSFRKNGTAGRI